MKNLKSLGNWSSGETCFLVASQLGFYTEDCVVDSRKPIERLRLPDSTSARRRRAPLVERHLGFRTKLA